MNLSEMATALGVNRQTLSGWVTRWPELPVLERGDVGREYRFNPTAVIAFLRSRQADEAQEAIIRDQALTQLVLPAELGSAATSAGSVIREQIEATRLRGMLREEAVRSGRLIDAAEVSEVLSTSFVQLNRALHGVVRQVGREHGLPDAVIRAVDAHLSTAQRRFVENLAAQLTQYPV